MGAVLNALLRCLLRMLTLYFDFQGLVSTRAPSSFNFFSTKGGGYFCVALNKLLEAFALFLRILVYGTVNVGFFLVQLSETFFHVEYFSKVL
jgi:hypothetical protein